MIMLTDAPDPRFETILGEGLADYNFEETDIRDRRALAVTVRDSDTGDLAGGLIGRTTIGLFFLDLFYLPRKLRGGGIGSQALRLAEEEAARRGCRAGVLITINIQAPEFYARHGRKEFGRVPSAPGVERIFMSKILDA